MTSQANQVESKANNGTASTNIVEPYRLAGSDVLKTFNVTTEYGLNNDQLAKLTSEFGENSLGGTETINYGMILFHQFFNAMILVLFISMIIALAIKDWISGGVIGAVVFINIGIGFVQEVKAERTMGSLRLLGSPTARITRNGNDETVPAVTLVPGDIVHVRTGDTVPADMRLLSSASLETDEALLTGESLPVTKDSKVIYDTDSPVPVGDRLNMIYDSSLVSKGRGTGVVVATGFATEIGKIALSLKGKKGIVRKAENRTDGRKPGPKQYTRAWAGTLKDWVGYLLGVNSGTPLQRKLSWLAIGLFWIAVVFAIVVMGSQRMDVTKEVAIYAICVALSMIPSALIVVLTITMAVGAQVMVTRNVIVRRLDSLEALGGVNDVCSDKTGTLTQGRMVAKRLWVPSVGTFDLEGSNEPYNPEAGDISFAEYSPEYIKRSVQLIDMVKIDKAHSDSFQSNLKQFLSTATLANIATVQKLENPATGELEWKAHGDATEIAIQVFCDRLGYGREKLAEAKSLESIREYPFDSSIKRMSAIWKMEDGHKRIYTKGAVERVLRRCTRWYGNPEKCTDTSEPIPFTEKDIETVEANMETFSNQGLRVLAFASRDLEPSDNLEDREQIESDLVLHGIIGIYDPPRLETAASVKLCHGAGINVHMLTGDHLSTARAIAREVGIIPSNLYDYSPALVSAMCMAAPDFDNLTDAQIDDLPVLPLVVARCAPQTKVRMIEALHRRNLYCAMTGDGVNDSPSLKQADVGIAMGENGSDVAKDASDIILTDDNFASILHAIEEGRRMAANIQKFVLQLLAENVAQAIYLMVGLAFMDKDGFSVFPLSPVEVLWILVITSCFPAMGLGQEKASQDILERPPNRKVFTKELLIDMVVYGFWMAACCLATFTIIVFGKGDGNLGLNCNTDHGHGCDLVFRGRSASFATMTWCALILAWECVHPVNSLFRLTPETELSWWRQTAKDLWGNQLLFWSIIGGSISVFPIVYIPVINDKVFLHKGIGYEWGVAIGFSVLYIIGIELWKWAKRVYSRHWGDHVRNPERDLEKNDVFRRYSTSFSRASTMVEVKKMV